MLSVFVNTVAVLLGSAIGLLLKKGIPKRFSGAIMTGIGLCMLTIGISGALQGENLIILVVSVVLGVITGTALKLDDRLTALGDKLEKRFAHSGEDDGKVEGKSSISQGFVTASLLFCVGAMAIIGSINSGLTGDHTIIYTKSFVDLISACILAASLGIGVLFSAASIFLYQGLLVLLAQLLRPLLTNSSLIAEIGCAGSVIIIALGLNLIGIARIKVADFLPAIVFVPIVYTIAQLLSGVIPL